jgi:hypothetical protein
MWVGVDVSACRWGPALCWATAGATAALWLPKPDDLLREMGGGTAASVRPMIAIHKRDDCYPYARISPPRGWRKAFCVHRE